MGQSLAWMGRYIGEGEQECFMNAQIEGDIERERLEVKSVSEERGDVGQ